MRCVVIARPPVWGNLRRHHARRNLRRNAVLRPRAKVERRDEPNSAPRHPSIERAAAIRPRNRPTQTPLIGSSAPTVSQDAALPFDLAAEQPTRDLDADRRTDRQGLKPTQPRIIHSFCSS